MVNPFISPPFYLLIYQNRDMLFGRLLRAVLFYANIFVRLDVVPPPAAVLFVAEPVVGRGYGCVGGAWVLSVAAARLFI